MDICDQGIWIRGVVNNIEGRDQIKRTRWCFPPQGYGVCSSFGIKWNTIQLYYIFADDDMWDDEASLDYRQALTLEMKRQQIQRELQQMEEEEEEREQAELIQQKEVSPGAQFHKTSATILCLRINFIKLFNAG